MYAPIETYRGVVYPWVIDHVGHMNVQFYTARFDEASWHFLARLGLTPSFLERSHRGAAAVEQRTQYKRELVAGSLVHITSELLSLGRTSLRFVHRMFDSETGEVVAESELVGVFLDTDTRSATPLPPMVQERSDELRVGDRDRFASKAGTTPEELTTVT